MADRKNRAIIETVELTKVFKDFWGRERVKAIDRLNLTITRGEVFGLLGPNGSGKSTTIRMLLGLLFPTRGYIRIFGRSPRDIGVKKRIGYMPEESHLYKYLDAEETLDFYGRLFRIPPKERRKRVDYLIDLVGLSRARHRPMREYSKGMARRIGIAQALINDPDLILLDEPTTGLDPLGTREVKNLIVKLKERNKTILLCSHLLADVEDVCDRLAILYGGRERALGPIDSLLSRDERTEIVTQRMKPETVRKVIDLIRQDEGEGITVTVGKPRSRLEDYFAQVVEDARRERLATSGAEAGQMKEGFLLGAQAPQAEAEGGELVEELVSAGREVTAPVPQPENVEPLPEPRQMIETAPDRNLLTELTGIGPRPAAPKPETHEREVVEPAPAPPPETSVNRDLLNELLDTAGAKKPKKKDQPDERKQ